jgi:glycyl-tRNA synthetase beta subunit
MELLMANKITSEHYEALKDEYDYVSLCLSFAQQRFQLLVNQGINVVILQNVINDYAKEKARIQVEIAALNDFLKL